MTRHFLSEESFHWWLETEGNAWRRTEKQVGVRSHHFGSNGFVTRIGEKSVRAAGGHVFGAARRFAQFFSRFRDQVAYVSWDTVGPS